MRYLLGCFAPRPFIGSLMGAGAVIGSALIGREGTKEQNAANAHQAALQMEWQERMSNTAHQREVRDLRAAGLNPILSGTGGAGSSTPPGAMARMENVEAATASSAMQAATVHESLKNLKETNAQIAQDTKLKLEQTRATHEDIYVKDKERELLDQKQKTEEQNTRAAEHTASILSNSAKAAELEGDIDETKYGAIMRYIDRAVKAITGGSSAIRNIKP